MLLETSSPTTPLQRFFARTWAKHLAFLLVLILVSLLYKYQRILHEPPKEIHLWRQADCLSLTDFYYEGHAGFFNAEMHQRFSDDLKTGKVAGEFPILYYFVGNLWKIFGKSEFLYRLVCLLICYIGLFCLYRILLDLLKSWFFATASAMLLLASPVYAQYGVSFLTNVPALNMLLVAWFFFWKFWNSGKSKHLVWAAVFFTLTGLLKVSTLISFMMLLGVYLVDVMGIIRFRSDRKIFTSWWKHGAILGSVLVLTGAWYVWVQHYNDIHGGSYTFTRPMPGWDMGAAALKSAYEHYGNFVINQIYASPVWIYSAVGLLLLFISFRKTNKFWLISIPVMMVGYVFYLMLFTYCMDMHDYYHVDALIFFVFINAAILHYLKKQEPALWISPVFRVFFSVFVLYNSLYCANNLHLRYWGSSNKDLAYNQLFSTKFDIDYFGYTHWYNYRKDAYRRIDTTLIRLGIPHDQPVLAIDDYSFNVSLYSMNRRGWTNISGSLDSARVAQRIDAGAAVMITEGSEHYKEPQVRPWLKYKLGSYDSLIIFDLRPYREEIRKHVSDTAWKH